MYTLASKKKSKRLSGVVGAPGCDSVEFIAGDWISKSILLSHTQIEPKYVNSAFWYE